MSTSKRYRTLMLTLCALVAPLLVANSGPSNPISQGDLTITSTSLKDCFMGAWYAETLHASGGTGEYTWTATGLPEGIYLETSIADRLVGYAEDDTLSTHDVTLTVTDESVPDPQSASVTLQLTVLPQKQLEIVTPVDPILPVAAVSTDYSVQFEVAPYEDINQPALRWKIAKGSTHKLPSGLALDDYTGELSGTPDPGTEGTYYLTVRAKDVNSPAEWLKHDVVYVLNVVPVPTILTTSLPNGVEGQAYGPVQLDVTGGTPPYSWELSTGLPGGLSVDANNVLSGVPGCGTSQTGTFDVQLVMSDSAETPAYAWPTLNVTITIAPGPDSPEPISLPTLELSTAYQGVYYEEILYGTGGLGNVRWSVEGLPTGLQGGGYNNVLTISGWTYGGVIGDFPITLNAYDQCEHAPLYQEMTILSVREHPQSQTLSILTSYAPDPVVGEAYVLELEFGGDTDEVYCDVSGLPAGLQLVGEASSGWTIVGVPASESEGVYIMEVSATNQAESTASTTLSFTVRSAASTTTGGENSVPVLEGIDAASLTEGAAAAGCSVARAPGLGWIALLVGMLLPVFWRRRVAG